MSTSSSLLTSWSRDALLSCTAFEFGDPVLSPAAVWAQVRLSVPEPVTLHPSNSRVGQPGGGGAAGAATASAAASSAQRQRSTLVTATMYPLHPAATTQTSLPSHRRPSFGAPFHGATVRITRQSVSVYRSVDRMFFVDIRWEDVEQLKRRDDTAVTEVAVVSQRGILVLDILAPAIAAGVWSALQLFHHYTEQHVAEELTAAHASGNADDPWQRRVAPSSSASRSGAVSSPDGQRAMVERAQQVLDRFLGPGHNLCITSPGKSSSALEPEHDSGRNNYPAGRDEVEGEVLDAPRSSSGTPPYRRGLHSQSPAAQQSSVPRTGQRSGSTTVSAHDRVDRIRREQDEQLARLRRREEIMRQEIHHESLSRSVTRSQSAATVSTTATSTSVARGGGGGLPVRVSAASPAAVVEAGGAGRSAHTAVQHLPRGHSSGSTSALAAGGADPRPPPRELASRAPLPTTATLSASAPSASRGASAATSYAIRESSLLDDLAYRDISASQTSRQLQRDEIASEIEALVSTLGDAEREAVSGASAQTSRLASTFGLAAASATPPTEPTSRLAPSSSPTPPKATAATIVAANVASAADADAPPSRPQLIPAQGATLPAAASSTAQVVASVPSVSEASDVPADVKVVATAAMPSSPQPAPSAPAPPSNTHQPTSATVPPAAEPGPGWKRVISASGKPYYVHEATKKTTWKLEDTQRQPNVLPSATAAPATKDASTSSGDAGTSASREGAIAPASSSKGSGVETTMETKLMPTNSTASVAAIGSAAAAAAAASAALGAGATAPSSAAQAKTEVVSATAPVVATAHSHQHVMADKAELIQDPEAARRENELRKKAALDKAEEDKQHLKIGKMSLMEALLREQAAMAATTASGAGSPASPNGAPKTQSGAAEASPKENLAASPTSESTTRGQGDVKMTTASPADDSGAKKSASSAGSGGGSGLPAPGANLFGSWKELYDVKSKRHYYRHVVTNESTWKVPPEVAELKNALAQRESESAVVTPSPKAAPAAATAATAVSPSESSSPAGSSSNAAAEPNILRSLGPWREKADPKTGRKFYVNKDTKKSTWRIEETPFHTQPQDATTARLQDEW